MSPGFFRNVTPDFHMAIRVHCVPLFENNGLLFMGLLVLFLLALKNADF